jgi:Transcription initiation factor IIA, gamma subunit, helical domain
VPLLYKPVCYPVLTERLSSIGMALTDTLDDLISERRIEPQLAMKILANFDRSITEVLADKVKARLTFKVHGLYGRLKAYAVARLTEQRVILIPTVSVTRSGPF